MYPNWEGFVVRKIVVWISITVLTLSMLNVALNIQPVRADSQTVYVDDDNVFGPWEGTLEHPYRNITSGIEQASSRDKIIVLDGMYPEGQIDVTKTLTLEANGTVVVDGFQQGHVFNIVANHTTLKGFKIRNSSMGQLYGGIYLYQVQNCTIADNKALDNYVGIYVDLSSNNTIIDNEAPENTMGILLRYSDNNTLINNTASDSYLYGVLIKNSTQNVLVGNKALSNKGWGYPYEWGIRLLYSDNCTLVNNNVSGNTIGIYLVNSDNNTIYHNNFIDNTHQVNITASTNIWDNSYPSGGNYWSDYNGTDVNGDGIGDLPHGGYSIDKNNTDYHPLMRPHIHDVAIIDVSASPSLVPPGENVTITVVAKNEGIRAETFNVTSYYDNNPIETQTVTDLTPDEETTLNFIWNTTEVSHSTYTIKAEADVVPSENKTADNTYIDGTVSIDQPPSTPSKPKGLESGYTSIEYNYYTNSSDPDGDNITYVFYWDDSTHSTVGPFGSGQIANASHTWWLPGTYNVTVRAYDTYNFWSNESEGLIVNMTKEIRYMQNAKWDSTYWKLFWNNTLTSTYKSRTKPGYYLKGYLGVKIYKGTKNISNVIEVGYWYNLQSGLKSKTWHLTQEHNVTGTYIKVEIWHKFSGESWTSMNVAFKTETFTQNTILNATTWTIYLWGQHHILYGPLGPGEGNKSSTTFRWGSSSEESRIEDMIFTTG